MTSALRPNTVCSALTASARQVLFASYDALRPNVPDGHIDAEHAIKIFAAGAGSGVLLTAFHSPLEMWKVRLQTSYTAADAARPTGAGSPAAAAAAAAASTAQGQKQSVLGQLAAAAQQRGGVRLLFRGSSMLLLRNIPGNGVFFSAFEGVRGRVHAGVWRHRPSDVVCVCVCVCVCARARTCAHGLSLDQKFGSKTILIAVKNSDQDLNSHATSPSSVFSSCTFLTLYAAWRPGRTIALLACGASC